VVWYQHYNFFLRYGLQDRKTVVVNTSVLFLLLLYVYPLKFLTQFLFEITTYFMFGQSGADYSFIQQFSIENMRYLLIIYGLGAALLFLSISWLYRHAYACREFLKLSEYEIQITKNSCYVNLVMASIPLFSFLFVLISPFNNPGLNFSIAGFVYFLYTPVMILFGRRLQKRTNKFLVESE
ncbi:MAG: hypothetical protein AAF789_03285, partial [Bacteroidota bacterium]